VRCRKELRRELRQEDDSPCEVRPQAPQPVSSKTSALPDEAGKRSEGTGKQDSYDPQQCVIAPKGAMKTAITSTAAVDSAPTTKLYENDLQVVIPNGRIEHHHLLAALEAVRCPGNYQRPGVVPGEYYGFTLGLVSARGRLCLSRQQRVGTNLTKLCTAYLKQERPD
jgi:hypothetical protein